MADALSHARHDRFAIAAAIGSDEAPPTLVTCRQCGALHRDLLSIRTALRHAWTPKRPRDLRLEAATIARLRPALWRRVLGMIGAASDAVSRPLAIGLTSVGILGVLLTSTATGLSGASSAASAGAAPIEVQTQATGRPTTAIDDTKLVQAPASVETALALSTGSLVAGGALLIVRGIAARARGMR